jgi:hypothetical protein
VYDIQVRHQESAMAICVLRKRPITFRASKVLHLQLRQECNRLQKTKTDVILAALDQYFGNAKTPAA